MINYIKYLLSITLLIMVFGCNKDIYIKPNSVNSTGGTIYYNYNPDIFDTYSFIIDDNEELKELIKLINSSEKSPLIALTYRFATIELKIELKEGSCDYYEVMISKKIGTYIYHYSNCEGTYFLLGRYKNDKLGEYFLNYFYDVFNSNK